MIYVDLDTVDLIMDVLSKNNIKNYRYTAQTIIGASLHFIGWVDAMDRVSYTSLDDDEEALEKTRRAVKTAWDVVFGESEEELWPAQQLVYSAVSFPRDSDEFAVHFDIAVVARRIAQRLDIEDLQVRRLMARNKAIELYGMDNCVWGVAAKAMKMLVEAKNSIKKIDSSLTEHDVSINWLKASVNAKNAFRLVDGKSYVSDKLQKVIGNLGAELSGIAREKRFAKNNSLNNV
jgi:hypothetical protein